MKEYLITTCREHENMAFMHVPHLFNDIIARRLARIKQAYSTYTNGEYIIEPLPTLESLQAMVNSVTDNSKLGVLGLTNIKTQQQSKAAQDIANGNYAAEGNEAWNYRQNYLQKHEEFANIFPNSEENTIREQERLEIYTELHKLGYALY